MEKWLAIGQNGSQNRIHHQKLCWVGYIKQYVSHLFLIFSIFPLVGFSIVKRTKEKAEKSNNLKKSKINEMHIV